MKHIAHLAWLVAALLMPWVAYCQAAPDASGQPGQSPGAQECSKPFVPAPSSYDFVKSRAASLLAVGPAKIGSIQVTRLEVFDEQNPKENNRIFKFANHIHILTREDLIKRQLLFSEGDDYDERLMRESARLLRAKHYLYDADIRIVRNCNGVVDLEVITRDVWSLTAYASIDRSGGVTDYNFGIGDSNLLGRGAILSLRMKKDEDGDSTELVYSNKNLGGSRVALQLGYIDLENGSETSFQLGLPFFALDAKRAWSINLHESDDIENQYLRGREISAVRHESSLYQASYGFSQGVQAGKVRRWLLGVRQQESSFSDAAGKLPAPMPFPQSKKLTLPFVEYAVIEDKFEKRVNLNQIYRTEDLHTGYRLSMQLGFAAESFGADADRAVLFGNYSDTLIADDKTLMTHGLSWQGQYNHDSSKTEDLLVSYGVSYLRSRTQKVSLLARLEASWADNLNTNRQIVLGGNTGARAFDNYYQVGNRKLLLTLERRHFTDYHFLNLIRMGWVAFIDLGRAWRPGQDDMLDDKYLADIGLGLRLTSSKSDSGRFMHIDLAFPLTNRNEPEVDSYELSIRVSDTF